jgi:hypothetical protein
MICWKTLGGLVAQRLEQRTHNAHDAILHGNAQERRAVKIPFIHALLTSISPRSAKHLDAGNRKLN